MKQSQFSPTELQIEVPKGFTAGEGDIPVGTAMRVPGEEKPQWIYTGEVTLGPKELQAFDAWNIYYLPSRGHRRDNLRSQRQSIMGALGSCNNIVIKIRPPEDPTSELVVSTNTGEKITLNDAVYGMEGAKDLREMLWPAMLLDE